jgi:hypothetical protein
MLRDLYFLNSAARLLIRYGRDTAATAVLGGVENIRAQLQMHAGPAWVERELRRAFDEAVAEIVERKMSGEDPGPVALDSETATVDLAAALAEADRRVRRMRDDEARYVVEDDPGLPPMRPGPPAWRGVHPALLEPPGVVDELRAALRASLERATRGS